MSTLELENIKHPDNANNNIALASNGSITVDRRSSDGTIAEFRKDGTAVGSIGGSSNILSIVGKDGNGGINIQNNQYGDIIYPASNTTGGASDNAIDLGYNNGRWKNLYLSGGVYLGGTGSANKLDDYEEGIWQPTFKQGVSVSSYQVQSGFYTKIGRVVHCEFYLQSTGSGATTICQVQGLPFTSSSTTYARGGGTSSFQNMVFSSTFQFYGSNNVNHFSCYYNGDAEVTFGGAYTTKYLIGTYTYITDA